jgi:hypothetical protein
MVADFTEALPVEVPQFALLLGDVVTNGAAPRTPQLFQAKNATGDAASDRISSGERWSGIEGPGRERGNRLEDPSTGGIRRE